MASVAMEAFAPADRLSPQDCATDPPGADESLPTGRFLTICAASALSCRGRSAGLRILPVELPIARLPNGIVTLKNRTISPVAQLFIDGAREVAKPLAKRK